MTMPEPVDPDPTPGAAGELRYADDDHDAWVVCPECGSDDALLKVYPTRGGRTGDRHFECPDCGRRTI